VTTFQLDECLNDANLADECNAMGKCTVHRYPRSLKQKPDDEMLPVVFSRNTTLVTTDRAIVDENSASIRFPNPGIIVIQKKHPHPPMTAARARRIIEKFKLNVPSWPTIDWSVVYVEIDEDEIYVSPLVDSDISKGRPFAIVGKAVDAEITDYITAIHDSIRERTSPRRIGN
jgi:hypothetical protein